MKSNGIDMKIAKRACLGLACTLILTAGSACAQAVPVPITAASTPAEAIAHYTSSLQNRDGRGVASAFHPQAMLHSIGGNNPGRQSIASFASTVRLGGLFSGGRPRSPAIKFDTKIMNIEGDAGVVRVDLDFGSDGIVDYLMVARIGQEWKIISKVFEGPASPLNADLAAARRPIEAFIASRASGNSEQLSSSLYSSAQIFSVVNNQLATVTVAQTVAAQDQARTANGASESNGVIVSTQTLGTTGYARFRTNSADGKIINRVAFLLKSRLEWRIISMHTWIAP
jgi:Putative lumazine-binding